MSIDSVMPSNLLILCHPLLLLSSIFPSLRVLSSESVLRIRWPKYWSFSFSISLSNGYSGLISFRMDWFDLLAVQRTLKSLLQHHSSKTSVDAFDFLCMMSFHLEGMRSLVQLCFRVLFHFVDFWCKILVVNHSLLFYFKILCFKHPKSLIS